MEAIRTVGAMFADGCNSLEMIALLGGAIVIIISLVLLMYKKSRGCGVFTIVAGLFHSIAIFITGNGYASAASIAICALLAITINILGWIILCGFAAKKVFKTIAIWCLFLGIFNQAAFFVLSIFGGLAELASLSGLVAWQFIILLISLIVDAVTVLVWIYKELPERSGDDRDQSGGIQDMTEDIHDTDITWMAD